MNETINAEVVSETPPDAPVEAPPEDLAGPVEAPTSTEATLPESQPAEGIEAPE
jgi:hypothetical protein